MKIFIVEDDLVIAESLANELSKWNYEVHVVDNFEKIMEDFRRVEPQLVLLDINLPTLNGFHWCQEMRKVSHVPIMFISSRTDNMDQILAIQMGGDDFIEKPFNLSLTVAKIQALLRRTYDLSIARDEIAVKGCKLIVDEAKLSKDNEHVQLSLTELQILKLLFQNENKYVSRTALIEKCWESENFIDDNTLAVNISIILIILLFFALIFYVFSLPFDAYVLAISIILLLMCVRWWIKYLSFKKNEHLKDKVAYLEHELAHVKNQQIEYRNDVESYFLTWVHQIKTPITASQLLLERNEENVVNRVRQEIVHIDNYTSLALSYLKLLNEESDMTITKVTVDDLIRPLILKYRIQFIEQKTQIHYEKSEDIILTDAQWASIMIEQLLNNALKYAKGKDIWIDFDVANQTLQIKDNGIGISKADIPKIFDKGYSGFNGRLNEQSTGIGLFIVQHIANHLNIQVTVQSELNHGTVFFIHFTKEK